MSMYVVDSAEFRKGEDIAICVCVGRFGSALKCAQELYTGCVQHSGTPDIWGDAYHALYRCESAELVLADGPVAMPKPTATTKAPRVTHVTCFIERARGRVQDAAGRFTVSIDSAGRVRGEAVATALPVLEIARMRVDPSSSASEIGLAVLLHLASREHQPAVTDLMQRMRRGDKL